MAPRKRRILVTNALPYANGYLHLGHMVGFIQADILARFQRLMGHECYFFCGSDCHGTPIMIQANKQKISPDALVAEMQQAHYEDASAFLVQFDYYHTTHSVENEEMVHLVYERQNREGHIAKRTITQYYDEQAQMFLPDRYIKGECPRCHAKDQYGDNCEQCGASYTPTELINPYSTVSGLPPILKESEHYFFKLPDFENFLKEWTHQDCLQSEVSKKLDEWFKEGLREWDISRDAPYFGIRIPGESNKYFYVWLDAPIGYLATFQAFCKQNPTISFDEFWGKDAKTELHHIIGKDIIYFHALFWPALLYGADLRTPNSVRAHGFLTINSQKMSKSRGTFILGRTYLQHLLPEYLRYYFASKLSEHIEDIDLQFDDFMQKVNSDLVGKLVNLPSRTANFITKYFNNRLSHNVHQPELIQTFQEAADPIASCYEKRQYAEAMKRIMHLADHANEYVNSEKPWQLVKANETLEHAHAVCTTALNLFRILMVYLKPVLPDTAKTTEAFLKIAPLTWEDTQSLLLDHEIDVFKPMMQRITTQQIEALQQSIHEQANSVPATT